MRTVEFKVIETDPAEFCIVAQDTVIHTGEYFEGSFRHLYAHQTITVIQRVILLREKMRRATSRMSVMMISAVAASKWPRFVNW
jgi:hypothetical protein